MSFAYQGSSPDRSYYDITITNLNTGTESAPVATFSETRQIPFVYDPEQYFLCIERFTLDTPTLPVFTPTIQPASSNPNLTIYSTTMEYTYKNGDGSTTVYSSGETFLIYSPQDLKASVPAPPSATANQLQNNSTGYYYIYNYQYWISLVNTCLATCYQALVNVLATSGKTLGDSSFTPFLTFDPSTSLATLNVPESLFQTGATNYMNLYFNASLFQLFSSFPILILPSAISIAGRYQIVTTNFGQTYTTTLTFPTGDPDTPEALISAIQVTQEYCTIALWTPITSIVFCSSSLPIVPNNLSSPLLFYSGIPYSNNSSNNVAPIITDFVSDNGIYKPNIVYHPSAEYRLCEMHGNTPLYRVDIAMYWKDRQGELQPFRLSSGSSATIKILFIKKPYYSKNQRF